MEIALDFSFIAALGSKSPLEIMWILFVNGGWIIVAIGLLRLWWVMRLYRLQGKFLSGIEYVLLAIDVPKDSEQTPKAMEQVFATITGAHQEITKRDKYFKGEVQLSFSFEIVSIDGFVQFLIRTPKILRDLVEGSVYAQYPDAEITEVEDYVNDIPSIFPNEKYKIWGTELQLVRNEAFPIRTYRYFEDQLSQELKDPLASLIETMSRVQKNEQVWIQMILVPMENSEWVKRNLREAYKIAGKKPPTSQKKSALAWLTDSLYKLPDWISWLQTGEAQKKQDQLDFRVLNLTPGERAAVEAIEIKASKLGFTCKFRLVYVSTPEQYQPGRVVNSVFGAVKQFGDLTSNSLKPNKRTKTSVVWFFVDQRANARRGRLMRNYKKRSWYLGSKWFVLNVEELATLYHFPSAIAVKSPYLKRTEVKKSDSPTQLPKEIVEPLRDYEPDLRRQLVNLQLDNDYYEKKYAKAHAKTSHSHTTTTAGTTEKPQNQDVPNNLPIAQ